MTQQPNVNPGPETQQPPLGAPETNPSFNPGPDSPGPGQPLADPSSNPGPDEAPAEQPPLEEPPLTDDPSFDPGTAEVLGAPAPQGGGGTGTQRDPEEWVTGDDPATEAQKSYLDTLARAAGEQIPADGLTKAQASEHIDRLQAQTGRPPRQS